jgi:hypothetical protein
MRKDDYATGWERWGVAWTMRRYGSCWMTGDLFSTLPIGWIPNDGFDLFLELLAQLTERWSELCTSAENYFFELVG